MKRRRVSACFIALLVLVPMLLAATSASALPRLSRNAAGVKRAEGRPIGILQAAQTSAAPTLLDDRRRRVRIDLLNVTAHDTEDVGFFGLGAGDEFYLLGTVGQRTPLGVHGLDRVKVRPIATSPRWIRNGQTISFYKTVFEDTLGPNDKIDLSQDAWDEDFGKDWSRYRDLVNGTLSTTLTILALSGPISWAVASTIFTLYRLADAALVADGDDKLRALRRQWRVTELPIGDAYVTWRIKGNWAGGILGYSTWDYTLRYRINSAVVT